VSTGVCQEQDQAPSGHSEPRVGNPSARIALRIHLHSPTKQQALQLTEIIRTSAGKRDGIGAQAPAAQILGLFSSSSEWRECVCVWGGAVRYPWTLFKTAQRY
jgi:hypothetical protein